MARNRTVARVFSEKPEVVTSFIDNPEAIRILRLALDLIAKHGDTMAQKVSPPKSRLTEYHLEVSARAGRRVLGDGRPTQPGTFSPGTDDALVAISQLYQEAAVAQTQLTALATEIAATPGCEGTPQARKSLKSQDRIMEKLDADYNGDPLQVLDIAGAKIQYDNLDTLYWALDLIIQRPDVKIVRFKDRFAKPFGSGYQDILMNLRMSNGHIAEFRLHLKAMDEVANIEHATYEFKRSTDAMAKAEGRQITDAEQALLNALDARTRPVFDQALSKAGAAEAGAGD